MKRKLESHGAHVEDLTDQEQYVHSAQYYGVDPNINSQELQNNGQMAHALDATATVGEGASHYRTGAEPGSSFEYLEHTADVQLHAWGGNLKEAFENAGLSLYNYMVPLANVGIDSSQNRTFAATGHDLDSLLYEFLSELLVDFESDLFICKQISIKTFDRNEWRIEAQGCGEPLQRGKHETGTEVKAITFSNMQIIEKEGDAEVFVIIDI
eukprot:jgi/Botrbrau1/17338/Bobra.0015s0084.1